MFPQDMDVQAELFPLVRGGTRIKIRRREGERMFGHFLVSSRNDVVTLFAFIYVQFQMSPPIACNRRCIVTLVAFMWFFAILCVFKCILKETQAKSH